MEGGREGGGREVGNNEGRGGEDSDSEGARVPDISPKRFQLTASFRPSRYCRAFLLLLLLELELDPP